jgi:fatty-acyl-CoA synthase
VDDGSGEKLLPDAIPYEQAIAEADPKPPEGLSADDLYILYTGGTTGMPKGVLWRQEDIFYAALSQGSPGSVEEIVERARGGGIRSVPAPPFMHGAAHWASFNMWHVGGTVIVQSDGSRLDAHDVWSTIEREKANHLLIVGDAFARPLLDQLGQEEYDLSSLVLMSSGGAILTAALKDEFLERLPQLRVMDALGSSESGAQAATIAVAGQKAQTGQFAMAPGNLVLRAPRRRAGSHARDTSPSATTRTRRRRGAPSPWSAACATQCPGIARRWGRTAPCACSAATR